MPTLPLFRQVLLQKSVVMFFGVCGDQRLSVSAEIAPAEQIQSDLPPERAFVGQPASAAVAGAEPYLTRISVARGAVDAERSAADAGFPSNRG